MISLRAAARIGFDRLIRFEIGLVAFPPSLSSAQNKRQSIYYVRTEVGEGAKEVANFANDSTDGSREMRTKREGVQNIEKLTNVINGHCLLFCWLWHFPLPQFLLFLSVVADLLCTFPKIAAKHKHLHCIKML